MKQKKRFAAGTKVSVDRTVSEIRATLLKYDATKFLYGHDDGRASIGFEMQGRRIRFTLTFPTHRDEKVLAQMLRSSWRSLLLCVKAKLEAVASEIETFDEAFMPHIILPNGKTFAEQFLPKIKEIYESGYVPPLTLGE